MVIFAIVATVIAVVIVVVGIVSVRSERDLIEERLGTDMGSSLNLTAEDLAAAEAPQISVREQMTEALDNALANRGFAQRWRKQLSRADIKITVAEFAAVHFISVVGFFAASFFLLARGNIIVAILAGFVGLFAPQIYVARQVSGRLIRFEEQLPDTLGLWVNALRSGYSVMQSMEAISRDAPEPTATEFKRVIQEVQLGIDMEDALQHMLVRLESEDFDLVVTAVNIQREVGGNLAEILEVIAHTIRERIKLKGEIRVMTSQGRVTGYLISGLPIALAGFLSLISPGFITPLFTNRECGWPLIGIGFALIGIGSAAIQKIIDIDI
ncbi:MAG: type II secretion system F family protein [Phototrophicaceae bacterium]|jgi:tight adherence protein B